MKIKDWIFERYLPALLVSITIIVGGPILSYLLTGNWITIFISIPITIWMLILTVFLIWFIIILIRKKMHYYTLPFGYVPMDGWLTIGDIDYEGVKWRVRTPRPTPMDIRRKDEIPSIDIEMPPRCPKCETELETSDSYLWYSWNCVNCGFKKRTWNSSSKIKHRVNKIAKREIEHEFEKDTRKM